MPRPIAGHAEPDDHACANGYEMFVSIVSGLATGGIMVALIECATPVAHFVTRVFS
ncbi:hypothetical protein C8J46_11216 [Sphingomonas sp. PP-F2F-A104-K0414]|uniref:hypothetical protein n=1 Tax=Sphingomonas sp. PP-F2F-A104-K0414 TaxID=2135661 RepID=UPI0010ED9607|nr:hypothetical protein [Sphingomonas sp. PP-F2F-A104-K0414]TCP95644.1 hypothetical protein C8J46_11216 [Sphingomonas sp. PP-F2F-A104-K0414]